ncbi:MAG TPA: 3-hydroxybutyryl-CoA dehydrogenase [Thermomicrobiaceae bacterium]|nr:3-hydroxybutyryl-CoA dehydrogenase [Thermomicrobiaceae bacterium]
MEINRVAVVGAGTMGSGIVQVVAQAQIAVTMIDRESGILDHAVAAIERNLARGVERDRISQQDADIARGLIDTDVSLESARDVDIAIEAVNENLETKLGIFRSLDRICAPEAILASNTSSISITRLGAATDRPERVIGMHFFNPVPVMQLVEVVRGLATTDDTARTVTSFAERLGKTAVTIEDFPGFISNRVLMPMINEAIYCLLEGVANAESIDTVMKLGMNHPMGPLALADLIGLDVCLDIMEVLHHDLGESKYRPCPLLRKMVAAGRLGRKSGQGFFSYG